MAYTPVKMAWHTTKHMQGSSSQEAHINHGKNDKCPITDKNLKLTLYSTLEKAFRASI